jgi:hypothetical protein
MNTTTMMGRPGARRRNPARWGVRLLLAGALVLAAVLLLGHGLWQQAGALDLPWQVTVNDHTWSSSALADGSGALAALVGLLVGGLVLLGALWLVLLLPVALLAGAGLLLLLALGLAAGVLGLPLLLLIGVLALVLAPVFLAFKLLVWLLS